MSLRLISKLYSIHFKIVWIFEITNLLIRAKKKSNGTICLANSRIGLSMLTGLWSLSPYGGSQTYGPYDIGYFFGFSAVWFKSLVLKYAKVFEELLRLGADINGNALNRHHPPVLFSLFKNVIYELKHFMTNPDNFHYQQPKRKDYKRIKSNLKKMKIL